MSWIKISDDEGGVFALEPDPDPAVIVTVSSLEAEIAGLEENIAAAEKRLIPVPDGIDDRVAEAINAKNGEIVAIDIVPIENILEQKRQFLADLLGGDNG